MEIYDPFRFMSLNQISPNKILLQVRGQGIAVKTVTDKIICLKPKPKAKRVHALNRQAMVSAKVARIFGVGPNI